MKNDDNTMSDSFYALIVETKNRQKKERRIESWSLSKMSVMNYYDHSGILYIIQEMRAAGGSWRMIAEYLNDADYKNSQGREFNHMTVKKAFTNARDYAILPVVAYDGQIIFKAVKRQELGVKTQ